MSSHHQDANHGWEEAEQYRKSLYEWARQQVREEDWEAFSEEEYSIAAEDVIADLERQQES